MALTPVLLIYDTVAKLAAYPWFHGHGVPKYDSDEYSNPKEWKKSMSPLWCQNGREPSRLNHPRYEGRPEQQLNFN